MATAPSSVPAARGPGVYGSYVDDVQDVLDALDGPGEWYDWVPVFGDFTGARRDTQRACDAYEKLDDLEDRVRRLYDKLRKLGVGRAWDKERERLRRGGPGSRPWTEKQKRDILDGKTPTDDKGRAIEGHHKKSVEDHPDMADDGDNIEFRSFTEHRSSTGVHGSGDKGYGVGPKDQVK